ncbi:MAG: vitamin K epoxide reductase family protein [Deltaproteobacteria bacterium]|nr:vitamin K epoxide reductase family protein [Deltaproteobacteria bacterium]
MSKAAKKKTVARRERLQPLPPRPGPNWPILALALAGMGLSGYLTFSIWLGQPLAGCTVGSGCDVVLNSDWSKLFGLPTSLWGFLGYGALAGIAFIKQTEAHWKLAWTVSLFGVVYSVYLTLISLIELKTTCPYCLASAILMLCAFATATYEKPASLQKFSWRPWLLRTVGGAAVLVIAIHLHYTGVWGRGPGPENPKIRALAEHLTKTKAKFYGTFWCPHCKEQKELFGPSVDRLPYIECSPGGRGTPQAAVCQAEAIRAYPTWVISGQRHEGRLSLNELAHYSGFQESFP